MHIMNYSTKNTQSFLIVENLDQDMPILYCAQRTNHAGLANSIFFEPSTPYEVNEMIRAINDQKTRRKLDPETKFIKYANPVVSVDLSISRFLKYCRSHSNI